MEKEYRILTECYFDFMLMETIMGLSPNDLHAGINDIGVKLKKNFSNKKAIILIDDDKKRAKFLDEFVLKEENKKFKIKLLEHRKNLHYAVQISPASEAWILQVCQSASVNVVKYGLPNKVEELKKITKSAHAFRNERLKQLLNTMQQKNPDHFKLIRTFVNRILFEKEVAGKSKRKRR